MKNGATLCGCARIGVGLVRASRRRGGRRKTSKVFGAGMCIVCGFVMAVGMVVVGVQLGDVFL